jgi:phosphoenolpyruvate synthase/pyruvate phosphate dikinase
MRYLIEFSNASDRTTAGGKGYGLHRLTSWGLNVPRGVVVASDAYDEMMTDPQVAAAVAELEANPTNNGAAAAVRDAISAVEFESELEAEVRSAWATLENASGQHLRVSCRSSATAEDSAVASFAGQFATILGVVGPENAMDAIKQCWASVWSLEALTYRASHNIPHCAVSMAVVIQQMVRAETSGVAFSVNPVFGDTEQVMINASWGLGEVVVSGLVTPDTFLVGKTGMEIVAREISQAKSVMHVMNTDGAVEELPVNPVQAMTASLNDEQVHEVARLAVNAEKHAGSPQDVEWAYEGGKLYVLQTRPITTL